MRYLLEMEYLAGTPRLPWAGTPRLPWAGTPRLPWAGFQLILANWATSCAVNLDSKRAPI